MAAFLLGEGSQAAKRTGQAAPLSHRAASEKMANTLNSSKTTLTIRLRPRIAESLQEMYALHQPCQTKLSLETVRHDDRGKQRRRLSL